MSDLGKGLMTNLHIPVLKPGWYLTAVVIYLEKIIKGKPCSFFEFQIEENKFRFKSLLIRDENQALIAKFKKILGIAEYQINFANLPKRLLKVQIKPIQTERGLHVHLQDFAPVDLQTNANPAVVKPPPKLVMIIDDQAEVGKLIGNYIMALGYIPDIYQTIDAALEKFNPDEYLFIISDIMMPGKNGFDLVRQVKSKYPDAPLALISGYLDKEMENMQRVFKIPKIYKKPVFINAVKEMVADAELQYKRYAAGHDPHSQQEAAEGK